MSTFRVTPGELIALSQQVQASAGQIESELSSLRGRVLPASGFWTGAGQERFQALYEEWNRSALGLQQALAGISALLGQAARQYEETEAAIASSFAAR